MTLYDSDDLSWQAPLARIRQLSTELMRIAPYRDVSLVPNPAATSEAIERAEQRLGRTLPPSYRSFLRRHDGWPRFFDGAALLGTRDLGKSSYADLALAVFEAAATPLPGEHSPPSSRVRGYPDGVIPFGIDPQAMTLFAFDPNETSRGGEMGVVAWIGEIGVRKRTFTEFLDGIAELCAAELRALSMHTLTPEALSRSA